MVSTISSTARLHVRQKVQTEKKLVCSTCLEDRLIPVSVEQGGSSSVWQAEPPLPSLVEIDLSNHYTQHLQSPDGWHISKRNARVIISDPLDRVVGLDAAHYKMLCNLCDQAAVPSEPFLAAVRSSCLAQQRADLEYHVPWSRHLLTCLRNILKVDILVGARAVVFNPHFQYFFSPDVKDSALGAVQSLPAGSALLLLHSFSPKERPRLLLQASQHGGAVWVLRQDQQSDAALSDVQILRRFRSRLVALLPSKSMVVHRPSCWQDALWDSEPARFASQIWQLGQSIDGLASSLEPIEVQSGLGCWQHRRYDFHIPSSHVAQSFLYYQAGQQDARQLTHAGLLAAADGSADLRANRQGTGFVVKEEVGSAILLELSAPVGGPVASLRAEAIGLFSILQNVEEHFNRHVQIMIFTDCLVLLLILSQWGNSDFWPDPCDVVHFDVIFPLINKLRKWTKKVILVKVKSHAGCFLNELADERAERGRLSDADPIFPGPTKYGSLQLRIQTSLRTQVTDDKLGVTLPRDEAPNKQILRRVVGVNLLRALKLRNTVFTRDVLVQPHGAVVRSVISTCRDSTVSYWMKAMTQTLPVAIYLHTINPDKYFPFCSQCQEGSQKESLSHFLSTRSKFHHARTAAHNQVCQALAVSLRKHLADHWTLFQGTPLNRTRLSLQLVPTAVVLQSGRSVSASDTDAEDMNLGRWQPDFIVISYSHKKIALGPEVCRPSDTCASKLAEAYDRKLQVYSPLRVALHKYISSGWTVRVLPWVVGARGLIYEQSVQAALEFLEIPRKQWSSIIRNTVQASVDALAFMWTPFLSIITESYL